MSKTLYGRHILAAGATALLLTGALPGIAAAAETTRLDVSIFHSERSAWSHAFKFWAAEVKKRTAGRVELRPFYSGSLSKINETYKSVRDGAVPVGTTSAASVSGQIPALAYIEAEAGMANDAKGWIKSARGLRPVLTELFEKKRIKYLWLQPSFGGTVNCRGKHLKKPADWKGLKIRTAGRWQVQQIKQLGASPVAMDPAEQYVGLQTGTLDCVLSNHEITFGFKLYEPAPKVTNLGVPVNVVIYLANPRVWNRISAADRKSIEAAAAEAEEVAANHLEPLQGKLRDRIKKAGGDVYSLSGAERKLFVNAIRPVFDRMDKETGAAGQRIRKLVEPYWQ